VITFGNVPALECMKNFNDNTIMRDFFQITTENQESFKAQSKVIGFFMINLTIIILKGMATLGVFFDIPELRKKLVEIDENGLEVDKEIPLLENPKFVLMVSVLTSLVKAFKDIKSII
jgi:hypothetical protein